ncbi:putative RNA-directed RNA polymerase [Frankliniella fusca]|uniref:RNA-directed RNA polymerase n=1 Tax=Frankliniella fusca TaxID=407009 RepID=A0AAE1HXT8_9NEOP|nr:putative RNA-directed RNA polymerase [Frankliniella fusca]
MKELTNNNSADVLGYACQMNMRKEGNPKGAAVVLNGLFDLTARRLVETQKEVFQNRPDVSQVDLIWKWGFDGSSAHAERKQQSDEPIEETSIILTAAVPLQLYCKLDNETRQILWQNRRPSSTRLCRPIQILNEKESKLFVKEHTAALKAQMKALEPSTVQLSPEHAVVVTHKPNMTMIDGKVKSYITDKAAQTCGICDTTPKNMNKVDLLIAKSSLVKPSSLEQGLSRLLRALGQTDVLHTLLVSSDPVINSYKPAPKRKHLQFPKAVLGLFKESRGNEALIDVFEEEEEDE